MILGHSWPKSNDYHPALELNKRNPRDRTLDFPFFCRYKHKILLETTFRLHKARLYYFGAIFAAMFALIYWLREFSFGCSR